MKLLEKRLDSMYIWPDGRPKLPEFSQNYWLKPRNYKSYDPNDIRYDPTDRCYDPTEE